MPADDAGAEEFKPLTAQEAAAWRSRHPAFSPWRVVAWQVAVGVVLAACFGVAGSSDVAVSAAWGSLAVWLPAAVFARALSRQSRASQRPRPAGSALLGLFVWEGVKVVLTVALLLVAPRVLPNLHWLALLAGFVVTLKVYGLAMVLQLKRPAPVKD